MHCCLLYFQKATRLLILNSSLYFVGLKTMLGAHVKRTSWLNTHYEAQWSGNLLSGHAHSGAIQWVETMKQKRMAFICILFNSKVQYYTNFKQFHRGFQWGNSTTITLQNVILASLLLTNMKWMLGWGFQWLFTGVTLQWATLFWKAG